MSLRPVFHEGELRPFSDSNFRLKLALSEANVTIQHGAAGTGNAWPDFTYEYDKVGNITKMTTLSTAGTDTQTFGYDELNRLVSASASGVAPTYSDAYAYNQIGNVTSFDGAAYTYSASHIHAVATANGVTYTYDLNGNMTLRDASGAVNDYSQVFNFENELESVTNNGSPTSFAYDAAGIRVKTTAPNNTITDYPFPGYEVENST
ncbi:MAG: RHS repeat protein, partial [Ardenticatenaceae bacterium]|nr:RHS repeat protein [Ardenticatenaceae bacterium]